MYKSNVSKKLGIFTVLFLTLIFIFLSFYLPVTTVKASSYQDGGFSMSDEDDFWVKYYNSINSIFFPTLDDNLYDSTKLETMFLKDSGCVYVVPSQRQWATAVFSASVELPAGTYTLYADVRTNSKLGTVNFGIYDATHDKVMVSKYLTSFEEWRTIYYTFTLNETSKVHIISQLSDTYGDDLTENLEDPDLVDSINPSGNAEVYCITTRGNIVKGDKVVQNNSAILQKVGSIFGLCLIVAIFCFVVYPYVKPLFIKKK